MKGNRLPAAIDLAVVTLDSKQISRGVKIPEQLNLFDQSGALDLEESRKAIRKEPARRRHLYRSGFFNPGPTHQWKLKPIGKIAQGRRL
jgi:hypothetical protein